MTARPWLAAAVLSLAPLFNSAAQAQAPDTATLTWDPPPAGEVCAYAVQAKGAPGFFGQQGTVTLFVPGTQTQAEMPKDPYADTTVYTVRTVGPAAGQSCATTPQGGHRYSGPADPAFINGLWIYFKGISGAAPDADNDGLPNEMEISFTHTDPAIADTDGDGLDDGSEYAAWVQWFNMGWAYDFDGDGANCLNDPDSDDDGVGDAYELKPANRSLPYAPG